MEKYSGEKTEKFITLTTCAFVIITSGSRKG